MHETSLGNKIFEGCQKMAFLSMVHLEISATNLIKLEKCTQTLIFEGKIMNHIQLSLIQIIKICP